MCFIVFRLGFCIKTIIIFCFIFITNPTKHTHTHIHAQMYDNFSKQCGFVSIKTSNFPCIFDQSSKRAPKRLISLFSHGNPEHFPPNPKKHWSGVEKFEDSRHVTCLIFSYKKVCVYVYTVCYYHTLTQTNTLTRILYFVLPVNKGIVFV